VGTFSRHSACIYACALQLCALVTVPTLSAGTSKLTTYEAERRNVNLNCTIDLCNWGDAVALRVERRTSDQIVAGSTPARTLLTQQP